MTKTPYLISRADVVAAVPDALVLFNPRSPELVVIRRGTKGGVDSPLITEECTFFPVSMAREHLDATAIFHVERGDWTVIPYTRCNGLDIDTDDFGGAYCQWT